MLNCVRRSRSGFTLTELAVVLAVVGVLAAGLYQLISGANQQSRDSSTAGQQAQLISAVKGYLNSAGSGSGQEFMANPAGWAANNTKNLPLPNPAAPAGNGACKTTAPVNGVDPGICDFLPPGFSSNSTNSYNQTYSINVNDPTHGAPSSPAYSFMILTQNGSAIPDASGARISSLTGGDGGFVYNTNICNVANLQFACGTSGAWSANITTTYGFGPPATGGYIASRSFVGNSANSNYTWLDRLPMPGDSATMPAWNTMSTNLFLGGQKFYLGSDNTAGVITGGGRVNMQGGIVDMQGGSIVSVNNPASFISITNAAKANNSPINVASGCNKLGPADGTCPAAVQVTGDETVSNLLSANNLFAQTFIYQGSDIRLKTDIHPLQDPLADIMRLKPVAYTLRKSGQPGIGVIAQDLEKVYPQLVFSGGDYKSVNYEGLIGPLIGAVQELKRENDQLRQELNAQAARGKKLEQKLDAQHPAQ